MTARDALGMSERTNPTFYDALRRDVEAWFAKRPNAADAVTRRSDAATHGLEDKRAEWTNALLNCIADVGRDRGLEANPTRLYLSKDDRGQGHNSCYDRPRRKDDGGEFMTDMAWWVPSERSRWWDLPVDAPLACELVVESEWGWMEGGSFDVHVDVVATDFSKLLFARAARRLLLTSCMTADRFRFAEVLARLRQRSKLNEGDVCVWLWDQDDSWARVASPTILYP